MKRKKLFIIMALLVLTALAAVFLPDIAVVNAGKGKIISEEKAAECSDIDCAVILGAGVRDGKPSPMLRDRLLTGISLYENGAAPKLIMSGDHGRENYDEVNVMKAYAVERGVTDSDVFMDHAGFSTYESIYRAKEIFEAKNIIIVSQKYHLYRALYIAEKLGLNAVGVSADLNSYRGQAMREVRELAARDKDFFKCIVKPKPTYLGDTIPVSGDGNLTND